MGENVVLDKSYKFALHTVQLYRKLNEVKHEYVISKAFVSDGTQIGAYIESAQEAPTRDGFWREMNVALQKAGRTKYWLNLLRDGGYLDDVEHQQALAECEELKRLLGKITQTTKHN